MAALLAVVFGRWPRAVSVAGAVVALGAFGVLLAGSDLARFGGPEMRVATWTLVMTPTVRSLLLFMCGGMVVLFSLAALWPEDSALVPGALAATALSGAALMIDPPIFGVFLILAATAAVLPMLVAGRPAAVSAVWQMFLLFTLAVPLLLTADALLASGQGVSVTAGYAVVLANLILLAGFPFYIWAGGVARRALPLAAVFVFGLFQAAVVAYLFGITDGFPAVRADPTFRMIVAWSSVLTTVTAAFLMGRSRTFRDLAAYAILFDMGMLLLAVVIPPPAGQAVAVAGVIARTLALLLLVVAGQRSHAVPVVTNDLSAWVANNGPRLQSIMRLVALLSLLGWPLTVGFAARWELLTGRDLPDPVTALALLATGLATWAVARQWPFDSDEERAISRAAVVVGLVLLVLVVSVGLFPQLLLEYGASMTGAS